jgi:hypothetical protein
VPTGGTRYRVKRNDTWISIARGLGIDPWDLIDFNFPGMQRAKTANFERASRQVNWYLREYVGCNTTTDGENWAFDSGLTMGTGSWKGGWIYLPPKVPPPPPPPTPVRDCSPTTAGLLGRRHTACRLLTAQERQLLDKVFKLRTLPALDSVAICDGLGKDGAPWTDMTPETVPGLSNQSNFQINMGDAYKEDLTSNLPAGCFLVDMDGTLSDLLVHEMTHVWQYHNTRTRMGVWASHLYGEISGDYEYTAGDPWDSYSVEQQAKIVEQWHHDGEKKDHLLYPYIRLVVRSGGSMASKDALSLARSLTLRELNRDLADLRARGLD